MSSKIVSSWRTWTWLAGIFVVAATAGGARAQLTTLPDAIFTQNLSVDETGANINPYSPCGFISCTGEGSSSASNFPSSEPDHGAQASFSGFPSPTVTVSASASSRGYGVANAQSDVVYSFEWMGPDDPSVIPVGIALLLHTQSTVDASDTYAQGISGAAFRLSQAGTNISSEEVRCAAGWAVSGPGCLSPDFSGTRTFFLAPNTAYDVELQVYGETSDSAVYGIAGPHGETTPSASAMADPQIFLEPGFGLDDPDAYQLVLSAGISNFIPVSGSPVPEPAAWAMMLTGFAGLGYARYWRGRRFTEHRTGGNPHPIGETAASGKNDIEKMLFWSLLVAAAGVAASFAVLPVQAETLSYNIYEDFGTYPFGSYYSCGGAPYCIQGPGATDGSGSGSGTATDPVAALSTVMPLITLVEGGGMIGTFDWSFIGPISGSGRLEAKRDNQDYPGAAAFLITSISGTVDGMTVTGLTDYDSPDQAIFPFAALEVDPIGFSFGVSQAPEPSTWVMMLFGFAGLGFAGYRRARSAFAL
jgi:hypothetical protein